MFIIKVNGTRHLWSNDKADDFIQFLPKHFKCNKSAIEAYYVESENEPMITPENIDSIDLTQVGKKVTVWPYSADGTFLGNVCDGDV
jgi:hypothetical protein